MEGVVTFHNAVAEVKVEAEEVSVVAAAEAEVPTMVAVEATTRPQTPNTPLLVIVTCLHFQVVKNIGTSARLQDGVWSH